MKNLTNRIDWIGSHGGLFGLLALLLHDKVDKFSRLVFKAAKASVLFVAGYVKLKLMSFAMWLLGVTLRLFVSKEDMTKVAVFLVIGYLLSKATKDFPEDALSFAA